MKWLGKAIGHSFGWPFRGPASAIADFLNAPEAAFESDLPPRFWNEQQAFELPGEAVATKLSRAKSIIVQGWRFLPHSYAIVNQWQLLALLRRDDLAVKIQDAPLYRPHWCRQKGVFEHQEEQELGSIAPALPGEHADLTLRMFVPFDFSASRSGRTAVFATLEHQALTEKACLDHDLLQRFRQGLGPVTDVTVVTPSRWSAEGFYKAGFDTGRVLVVPHGVDTATFHPMPELRDHIRRKIGVSDDEFVFLSVGAMTPNKGIDLLLRAFAEVSRKFPQARLILKGVNSLYHSRDRLHDIMQKVPARDQQRVISRLKYFGTSFSNRQMAALFQAADVYVSPYSAEGFNMPVLEAAASGVPVICTRGGATDDFVTDAFALRIESRKVSRRVEERDIVRLQPDVDHLIALMTAAIQDRAWLGQAVNAGPMHVRANYTWDRVADRLVSGLLN